MRSLIFNTLFYGVSGIFAVLCVILAFLPTRYPLMYGLSGYTWTVRFLMRWVAGIKTVVTGRERVPKDGPVIIAAKHQSYGDGIVMFTQFFDLSFVTGDHLEKYLFFKTILRKAGAIVVDNCGGTRARESLAGQSELVRQMGRRILIYPEGRLAPVGERFRYRKGVFHMYKEFGCPVVPVATSLGLRWPQQEWTKYPGRCSVEFLEPLPPGMDKDEFMARLEAAIEQRTEELVEKDRG